MMHLHVVPYIEGDQQDENHLRVEHHHTLGLSHSHVMIDGIGRFVRCTSKQNGRSGHWATSIMVHLKSLPGKTGATRLRCKDIDTREFLRFISKHDRVPTIPELLFDNPNMRQTPGQRLIYRKFLKLWNRCYVVSECNNTRVRLTDKGRRLLEQANA